MSSLVLLVLCNYLIQNYNTNETEDSSDMSGMLFNTHLALAWSRIGPPIYALAVQHATNVTTKAHTPPPPPHTPTPTCLEFILHVTPQTCSFFQVTPRADTSSVTYYNSCYIGGLNTLDLLHYGDSLTYCLFM